MAKSHFTSKLFLAAALAMGSAAPAIQSMTIFAADVPTPAVETVKAYQLFTGAYSEDMSSFGAATVEHKAELIASLNKFLPADQQVTDASTAEELAEALATVVGTETSGDVAFAHDLGASITGTAIDGTPAAGVENQYSFTGTTEGYYLIVAKDAKGTILSANLVKFKPTADQADLDVTLKLASSTLPTMTKQIKKGDGEYGDTAMIGIANSQIKAHTYKLTANVASNYQNYKTYAFKMHDDLPAGFTVEKDPLDDISNVTIKAFTSDTDAGTDVTAEFTQEVNTITDAAAGTSHDRITWSIDDLKNLSVKDVKKLEVEYTFTPDEADIANLYGDVTPYANGAFIEFANNPNGDGLGESNHDETTVHSLKFILNKVDDKGNPLTGAKFELHEKTDTTETEDAHVVSADQDGVFTWTGLEAGTYVLKETAAPAGYKKIADIEFTITENGDVITVTEDADPNEAAKWTTKTAADKAAEVTDQTISMDVANVKGPQMPVTGETGFTIATVAGLGVLVLSAVAINKKRKEN